MRKLKAAVYIGKKSGLGVIWTRVSILAPLLVALVNLGILLTLINTQCTHLQVELIGQINLYAINLLCGFKEVVLSPYEQGPLFSPGKERTEGRYKRLS